MKNFRRLDDVLFVNGEEFALSDLLMLYPDYKYSHHHVHYYDGKKHYVSDGSVQKGLSVPYVMAEELFKRMPELKMCRSQRLNDHKYFENLRNARR